MKRIAFFSLLLMLACSMSWAQKSGRQVGRLKKSQEVAAPEVAGQKAEATKKAAAAKGASIRFEKMLHDFGKLAYESDATATFTFTNQGTLPLVIIKCRATCGCTEPKWSLEPIKPGEKGEITVSYNTQITGPFNKPITVITNADTSSVVLTIKGTVESPQLPASQAR